MPIGYSAILLPQLAEDNGTMHVNIELGSWIGMQLICALIKAPLSLLPFSISLEICWQALCTKHLYSITNTLQTKSFRKNEWSLHGHEKVQQPAYRFKGASELP